MPSREDRMKMTVPELLTDLMRAQLGPEKELTRDILQARYAEAQDVTAVKSLRIAYVAVGISAVAALISLVALLSG
jgi:hypothetical protein